jgi:hypothetical protein
LRKSFAPPEAVVVDQQQVTRDGVPQSAALVGRIQGRV